MRMAEGSLPVPSPYPSGAIAVGDEMGNSIATLALAAATLMAPATLAQTVAPTGAVACVSVGEVFRYADAVDRRNAADQHKLLQGECRIVEGKPYALLEEH